MAVQFPSHKITLLGYCVYIKYFYGLSRRLTRPGDPRSIFNPRRILSVTSMEPTESLSLISRELRGNVHKMCCLHYNTMI